MKSFKSMFGITGAAMPVLYCAGLLYYFLDFSDQIAEDGLLPTVLGLALGGLLFCIPLIFKLVRFINRSRPRGPGAGPDGGLGAAPDDDDSGFDADAAIARYMAQRTVEAAAPSPAAAAPLGFKSGATTARPAFGRKK